MFHQAEILRVRAATSLKKAQFDPDRSHFHRFIDKIAFVVGVIAPLSTVPQIIQVYTTQSAEDLSLGTWSLFVAFTFFWLLYGIANRAPPLIITNTLWLVSYVVVIVGAAIYR